MGNLNERASPIKAIPGTERLISSRTSPSHSFMLSSPESGKSIGDYYNVPGRGLVLKYLIRLSPHTPTKVKVEGVSTPTKVVTGRGWMVLKSEEERETEKVKEWERRAREWRGEGDGVRGEESALVGEADGLDSEEREEVMRWRV